MVTEYGLEHEGGKYGVIGLEASATDCEISWGAVVSLVIRISVVFEKAGPFEFSQSTFEPNVPSWKSCRLLLYITLPVRAYMARVRKMTNQTGP